MRAVLSPLRFGATVLALGAGTMSLLAALGFAVPALDVLNHIQILIFYTALAGVVLVPLLVRPGLWRKVVLAIGGAGLLASGWVFVPEVVSGMLPRASPPSDGRPVLKAMTHNLFGLNYDMERVRDYVFREDPDILAVQEYFPEQRGPLHPMLVERYPYFALCSGSSRRANIGIYAKQQFTHADACADTATPQTRTSRIVATFTLPDGTAFSVLTTHLDWPYPVERQEEQRADLTAAINAVKGPLIVMGDMNSTPWSYAMRGMIAETGLDRQTRNLITWPLELTLPGPFGDENGLVRTIPFLPLDQVMTRDEIAVHELHAGPDTGSDHLPVVFTFSVAPLTECCLPN